MKSDAIDVLDHDLLTVGGVVVAFDPDRHVLRVILDRPQSRNAQTPTTWAALHHVGEWLLSCDDRLPLVVVTGTGPSFSAGLDRRMFTPEGIPGQGSLADLVALSDDDLDSRIEDFQRAFTWQREIPALTIAAVRGHAIGAGFQLALACDLVIATPDATFAMRETALGLVPDLGGTGPLLDAIGYPRAVEVCATGRPLDAREAHDWGLVATVSDDLDTEIDRWASIVAATPPGAIGDLLPLLSGARHRTPAQQRAAERQAQIRRLRALTGGRP